MTADIDSDRLRVFGVNGIHLSRSTIPGAGNGAFASRRHKTGDVVEQTPVLLLTASDEPAINQTRLYDYFVTWPGNAVAVPLGFSAMCNHSSRPNVRLERLHTQGAVALIAQTDIDAGDELLIDYPAHGRPLWFDPNEPDAVRIAELVFQGSRLTSGSDTASRRRRRRRRIWLPWRPRPRPSLY